MAQWSETINGITILELQTGGHGSPTIIGQERGIERWRLEIEPVSEEGPLLPRWERPIRVGDHILLCTDGEHTRGASSHEPRVHLISSRGKLCWTKPWRLLWPPLLLNGDLVLLIRTTAYRFESDKPVATALQVRVKDGQPLFYWHFCLSEEELSVANTSSWPHLSGKLTEKNSVAIANVEATWTEGKKQEKIRLVDGKRPTSAQKFVSR